MGATAQQRVSELRAGKPSTPAKGKRAASTKKPKAESGRVDTLLALFDNAATRSKDMGAFLRDIDAGLSKTRTATLISAGKGMGLSNIEDMTPKNLRATIRDHILNAAKAAAASKAKSEGRLERLKALHDVATKMDGDEYVGGEGWRQEVESLVNTATKSEALAMLAALGGDANALRRHNAENIRQSIFSLTIGRRVHAARLNARHKKASH